MKEIGQKEQKRILLEMLEHVDDVCRKNNIKYSLVGGSLIGAVRHKGFIPWDDDVDIVLTKDNFDKLAKILNDSKGRYQTLKYEDGGKCFNFMKLIDTRTQLKDETQLESFDKYGMYLDIFCYYPTSDNIKKQKKQFRKIKFLMRLIARKKMNFKKYSITKNIFYLNMDILSYMFGYRLIKKMFDKTLNKYVDTDSDYLIINWPSYKFEKEVQLKKNTGKYIDAKFENLTVMIFKDYDEILKTTFGNYMELPPESERIPRHDVKIWWREK